MTYKNDICDMNHIYQAFLKSVKASKWKKSSQLYSYNYLLYINRLRNELLSGKIHCDPVYEFDIYERGKHRHIAGLSVHDRIIRHLLCDEVFIPELQKHVIYDNGASLPNRGVDFSRKRFEIHMHRFYEQCGTNGWIFFGDIEQYYNNIDCEIAERQLLELVNYDSYLEELLDIIFENFHGRINIGDQLSQIVGVWYLNDLDTYIKYVKSEKFYGRYMDDFYIMSPSKRYLEELVEDVKRICLLLNLNLNSKKSRIVPIANTCQYLQFFYTLKNDGTLIKRINPKRVTVMRRKLKKLAKKYNNGEIEYHYIEDMFRSWMGSFRKLLSKEQRINLIKLYEQLFNKSIIFSKGKMIIDDRNERSFNELPT